MTETQRTFIEAKAEIEAKRASGESNIGEGATNNNVERQSTPNIDNMDSVEAARYKDWWYNALAEDFAEHIKAGKEFDVQDLRLGKNDIKKIKYIACEKRLIPTFFEKMSLEEASRYQDWWYDTIAEEYAEHINSGKNFMWKDKGVNEKVKKKCKGIAYKKGLIQKKSSKKDRTSTLGKSISKNRKDLIEKKIRKSQEDRKVEKKQTKQMSSEQWKKEYSEQRKKNRETEKVNYGDQFFINEDGKRVLRPNVKYTSPEGYTYETDNLGRIRKVEASELVLETAERNLEAQATVGDEYRLPTDDGGHLIGTQFKGSGDIDNLLPQNSQVNRSGGKWYKMEQEWRDALEQGTSVKVADLRTVIWCKYS